MIGDVWQEQQQRLQQQQQRQTKNSMFFSSFASLCRCCSSSAPPPLLYCSAVTEGDSSDSESETNMSLQGSSSSSTSSSSAAVPLSASTTSTTWKEQLLRYSNYASALCVVDCTVLPIVTLLLPLLGIVAQPASLHWLHHAGHQLALYFVLPVGFTATTTNYFYNHQSVRITALGWLGLALVWMANMHWHGAHHVLHMMQHGPGHRVANLLGCACLMGSNYWSRQRGCGQVNCGHDHPHSAHDHQQ